MPKKTKNSAPHSNPHWAFFKGVFSRKKYNLELLKLTLPAKLFAAFDWETLTSEASTYITREGQERRTDLTLSARFKETEGHAKIIFLVEHKAQKAPREVLLQLLEYQNVIYQRADGPLIPVIPIIIYQGKVKTYCGPVRLHDILECPESEIGEFLRRFILNFECFLLNVHDLNTDPNSDLALGPVLYIMQSIFNLDREVIKNLFAQGEHLSENEKGQQILMAMDYIQRVDPSFNWEIFREVALETEKGAKTVTLLERGLDEMIAEGEEKGREEGREEGREKGGFEKALEIARNLLVAGTDPEFVAKTTGLNLAEVRKLQKKIKA